MEDFKSSEEITRFLRRKGEKPERLLDFAFRVFAGEIKVYLPRRYLVLADWILDKLQTSKEWRLNSRAWELLSEVWLALDNEQATRSFGNHKFGTILADTFHDLTTTKLTGEDILQFFGKLANAIDAVSRAASDIRLLPNLFDLAGWLHEKQPMILASDNFSQILAYTSRLTNTMAGIEPKDYLKLLAIQVLPDSLMDLLQNAVLVHFGSSSHGGQPFSISDIMATSDSIMVVKRLFEIASSHSSGQQAFEELSSVYPDSIPDILSLAVKNNLKLKDESLKKCVSENIASIKCILKLNGNLLFDKESPIDVFVLPNVDNELASLTVEYYSSSRQMEEFLSKWKTLPRDSSWMDKEICMQISSAVKSVSPYQKRQMLDQFRQDDRISSILVDSLDRDSTLVLFVPVLMKMLSTTDSWALKSKIVSLHRDIVDSSYKSIFAHTGLSDIKDEEVTSFVECVLRVRELEGDFSLFHEVIDGIVLKSPEIYLPKIASRWFILINNACSRESISQLAVLFASNARGLKSLEDMLKNVLFYEQPTLCHAVARCLTETIDSKVFGKTSLLLLAEFPPAVFSRDTKLELLDMLVKNLKENLPEKLKLIQRLIKTPISSSLLSKEPKYLQKAFYASEEKKCEELGKTIFQQVTRAKGPEDVKSFVSDISKSLKKVFKSGNVPLASLKLACLISEFDQKWAQRIVEYFADNKMALKNKSIGNYLLCIPVASLDLLRTRLSSFFAEDHVACFPVLCKLASTKEDVLCLIALFSEYHEYLDDVNLVEALRVLTSEELTDVLYQVRAAALQLKNSGMPKVMLSFCKVMGKENQIYLQPFMCEYLCLVANSIDLQSSQTFWYVKTYDYLLKDKSWLVNQFMLEAICAFIHKISANQEKCSDELYIALCDVLSSILLFHRHRLTGRYHILLLVFQRLLRWLPCSSKNQETSYRFSRLLTSLCQPPVRAIRERGGKNNLTSSSALAKKQLARFLPALLIEYVSVCLSPGLQTVCKDELKSGVYAMMDILDPDGLKTASGLMDYASRAYLRPLYRDYQMYGKWQVTDS